MSSTLLHTYDILQCMYICMSESILLSVCEFGFLAFLVQRKPRDTSVIQKLQAVHSLRQPVQQQQQATVAVKPTITLTTSQAAAVGGAIAGMGGAVAMATATAGGGGEAATQKAAQIVQGAFPQGSILVVPHPTHPFHAVLPVFANTAVLMPQAAAAAAAGTVSTTTGTSTSAIAGSASIAGEAQGNAASNKKTSETTTAGESETVKAPATAVASSVAPQTILVQASPSSQSLTAALQQVSPSTVIQLSGSRNDVAMVAGASASEKTKESLSGKNQSSATATPKQQSEVHLTQAQKASIAAAALSSPQTATIALHPSLIPQALATGMLTATPGGGIKFQDYRQALALSGIPMIPVMPVKVGEPVKLSTIDFESQSIEITGEVPIKKLEIDTETGKVIRETLLSPSSEPTTKQRTESEAEPEKTAPRGRENGSQVVKETTGGEESHVDVEGESRQVEVGSSEPSRKSVTKESKEGGGVAFSGHSSSDIMSAQLLLSLTDGPHKDWSGGSTVPSIPPSSELQTGTTESPTKSLLNKEASIVLTPVQLKSSGRDETASPASSTSQTGGRKRKQKPIASAKPGDEGIESTPATKTSTTTPTPRGRRGGRKKKQTAEEDVVKEGRATEPKSSAKKKQASEKDGTEKETPGRIKQLSPEELLVLLDIPPSTGKASSKTKTPASKLKGKGKDKSSQDGRSVLQSSNATAKMEQLKASRAGKPMKEFVIETDSDSDSSSSGTSSSRFSPDSGSSSESSSDSSSEEGGEKDASETKAKPTPKKAPTRSLKGAGVARGRGGRGRGGRAQRKGRKEASSSEGSSSEDVTEETVESKKPVRGRGRAAATRGGGRGGRRGGRAAQQDVQQNTATKQGRGGHIVSIPTNLLSHKPTSGKKRKAATKEVSLP